MKGISQNTNRLDHHSHHRHHREGSIGSQFSFLLEGGTSFVISGVVFGMSAYIFVRYQRQQQQRDASTQDLIPFYRRRRQSLQSLRLSIDREKEYGDLDHDDNNHSMKTRIEKNDKNAYPRHIKSSSGPTTTTTTLISERGKTALIPTVPIQNQFFACLKVLCIHIR
jgi:hypothetical protein